MMEGQNWVIVPRESVGPIRHDSTLADVTELFGPPDASGEYAVAKSFYFSFGSVFLKDDRIVGVGVNAWEKPMLNGVRLVGSLKRVLEKFPHATYRKESDNYEIAPGVTIGAQDGKQSLSLTMVEFESLPEADYEPVMQELSPELEKAFQKIRAMIRE